jgi:lipopolysaccharide transport system permease protein
MSDDAAWTTEIKPKSGWFDIDLAEVWHYRDLVMMFVNRDFVAQYKQTILGPLWFLLQPLFSTVIFTVIFSRVAHIPTDNIPPFLFYMAGNVVWGYFSNCFNATSNTFVSNAYIFGKVYFPRLVMPVSTVISRFIMFVIQFALFLGFYIFFFAKGAPLRPNVWIFALPLLLLQMALMGLGFGVLISSLTTKYRDLTFLVAFGIQLWMYATPIVYPLSQVPQKYRLLMNLNPMTAVTEMFRYSFLGQGTINATYLGISWGITLAVLGMGIVLFSRVEKTFMDTV